MCKKFLCQISSRYWFFIRITVSDNFESIIAWIKAENVLVCAVFKLCIPAPRKSRWNKVSDLLTYCWVPIMTGHSPGVLTNINCCLEAITSGFNRNSKSLPDMTCHIRDLIGIKGSIEGQVLNMKSKQKIGVILVAFVTDVTCYKCGMCYNCWT